MKKFILGFAFFASALALTSCNKETCFECSMDGAETQEYCEDDFPTVLGVNGFDVQIEAQRAAGFTCTEK